MPLRQLNNPILARILVKQNSYQSKDRDGIEIQYCESGENKIAARSTF
jgi:hypothetical protein